MPLASRLRTDVPIAVIVAFGAIRITQGARYVAAGFSPNSVLVNAALFGGVTGLCCAILLGSRPERFARWAAVSAIAWMVAGTAALELAGIRRSGAFALSSWYFGAERGLGFMIEVAFFGFLSACGSTAALLARDDAARPRRVKAWLAWGAFGAAVSVVSASLA